MTSKERRAREIALTRTLDELDQWLYPQVAEAIDFARLDMLEQRVVTELERLISEGKLPTAPDAEVIAVQAAAMVATAIYQLPQDPRRAKHAGDDDCELCRMTAGQAPIEVMTLPDGSSVEVREWPPPGRRMPSQ